MFVFYDWPFPHMCTLESSGDVLSTVDMVVQRRDGPRRLRELDGDDDDDVLCKECSLFPF